MRTILPCPHCGGQMNAAGRGTTRGTARYFCLACAPSLQYKELFLAQVVRLGARDFGFVELDAMPHLGSVHFNLSAVRGGQIHIGDRVLVMLETGPQGNTIRALYPGAPAKTPAINIPPSRPHFPPVPPVQSGQARRWGVIAQLRAPDWGFIQDHETGQSIFVHATQCRGPILRVGQRVLYTPTTTVSGRAAADVVAA